MSQLALHSVFVHLCKFGRRPHPRPPKTATASPPRQRTSMIVPKEMDGGGRQWPFSHRPRLLLILVIRPLFFFSAFSTAPDLPCFIQAAVPRLLQQWPRTNPILPSSSVAVIYARQTCSVTLWSPLLVYFGWHAQRGAHSRSAAAASCLAGTGGWGAGGRRLT